MRKILIGLMMTPMMMLADVIWTCPDEHGCRWGYELIDGKAVIREHSDDSDDPYWYGAYYECGIDDSCHLGALVVPTDVDGYPVVSVELESDQPYVTAIYIPETVTNVTSLGCYWDIYGTVWAPEMHKADNGKWYVYSSGDVNPDPNVQDLKLFVLESRTDDPFAGFDFKSIPETRFTAIDPTVWMGGDGNCYMAYSFCKSVPGQDLGVRRMKTPWSFEGEHVCISSPDLPWENSARRRDPINEGPSVFTVGGRTFLAYSANGCWDDEYGVGLLELTSDDPMSANSWKKHSTPILKTGGGLFGPGHATFFKDRNGALWCSHHAMTKSNPSRTPTIRKAFVRPFSSDWLPLDHNGPL